MITYVKSKLGRALGKSLDHFTLRSRAQATVNFIGGVMTPLTPWLRACLGPLGITTMYLVVAYATS